MAERLMFIVKPFRFKDGAILPRFFCDGKRKFQKRRQNFLKFFYEILTIPRRCVI